jgi:hypothetical protein
VSLFGQGSTLGIVVGSAYGSATGTFTVTCADARTTTAEVTFARLGGQLARQRH